MANKILSLDEWEKAITEILKMAEAHDWRRREAVPEKRRHVGKLNAAKRKKIPTSQFGLPGERKYPMPDRAHAANAKARATQQVNKGNLSSASAAKIRAKANRILGE